MRSAIFLDHDGADRAGIGIEQQSGAKGARAGDPEPIDHGEIDRTAIESKLSRIGRSIFADFQIQPGAAGKAVAADHIQLPGEGAGLLQTDTQALAGECRKSTKDEAERYEKFQHSQMFQAIQARREVPPVAGSRDRFQLFLREIIGDYKPEPSSVIGWHGGDILRIAKRSAAKCRATRPKCG